MTIIQALKFGADKLLSVKSPSNILDAEVLLIHTIKKSKEYIFTNPEKKLSATQVQKYKSLIKRRVKFEPVAYLTGEKEFYGLNFIVNKNVLIPRPETELLVENIINYVGQRKITLIDVGTGSGAIAITLKTALPKTRIIATDISTTALAIAKKNADLHKADIEFIKTNLIDKINTKIDVIAANLPYVPDAEKEIKNIYSAPLKFEPTEALYGGKYGLDVYEKLFQQINKLAWKPKIIFCEIGATYINKTKQLTSKYFPQAKIEIKKDLCGKDRLLIIRL